MARGPDYADQLSEAERHTLDQLVGTVARRRARRAWRAPLAAAAAALAIVLGITGVSLLDDGGQQVSPVDPAGLAPAGGSGPVATATLAELAEAARHVPPPPNTVTSYWYRQRLEVVTATGEPCRILATRIETWEPTSEPYSDDLRKGRILAVLADPPAPSLTGCATTTAVPLERFDQTGDVASAWTELAGQLGELTPRYLPSELPVPPAGHLPTAAQLAEFLDVGQQETDAPGGWWAALVRMLASPQPDSRLRAEALRAAALRAEATTVPERTADLTGRPGLTVRVPYYLDGQTVSAELTFDVATGGLLQSAVYSPTRTEITVILALGRQ